MIATYTYFINFLKMSIYEGRQKNPIKYPMVGTITQKTKWKAKERPKDA